MSYWQKKAAAKREANLAKIPKGWLLPAEFLKADQTSNESVLDVPAKCGILSPEELLVTQNFDAVSLAKVVQVGSLKSEDVAVAFCKRAAIAQQLTNCLTETFFDDARKRGKWLDEYLAKHGKPVGPLHGLPISIKDPFNYTGVQSTLGLISYLDHPPAKENSALVDTLLDLGAILYCKTNIPQTMMTADSDNNTFGRTLNPHRLSLGAGGSSGGEGALVAMRGSVIGVGTDIGGSVRIPALVNGTYGFKPTPNRIPYGGQAFVSRRGSPGFPACAGPLTNSFEDMEFFVRSIVDTKPWDRDATAIAYPWRSETANIKPSKLRVGYFQGDSKFPIHPPVHRAIESAANVLAAAGHEVIPLEQTPPLDIALGLSTDYWSLDNTRTSMQHIKNGGEPLIPSLVKQGPTLTKKEDGYSMDDLFEINVDAGEYKASWNSLWAQNKLDVILCPGAETTAVPHDTFGIPPYTLVWNLLQYPGIIIPVGKADKAIDKDSLASNDWKRKYSSEDIHGAPMAIQLVARSFQDEELIAAARVIDQCLKIAENTGSSR
ncbi:hypothetical protein M409DRAFT_21067 [Zasmidium cellare ATCC 36951]|uniref:amidase n=1 Tax=Zasmidium cellare ATCC 36951 TaxID=1080233 RepID=A0A6A6CS97_ZASCE|nr:uncharacterized protein M409DRAFT_21067 [Zasmidium cellare ATCC 36951]KAF2169058.1 hypothetical protein M409DRAFT_21067 [Zasmidium cellare ATCC 36951]